MQNVQIQQYSMLLACGCIIGAQLSHGHGSNLCLQALKSAVTGWNNNCVLWLLTGASSESLQKETAVSHRTNRQARMELNMRRIVYIDSQSGVYRYWYKNLPKKIYQTPPALRMPEWSTKQTYLSTARSTAHERPIVPHLCKELAM